MIGDEPTLRLDIELSFGQLQRRRDREEQPRLQGLPMELAGLEPATSWVRSRRSLALSLACWLGFRGGDGPA
jgi:hypothetical protein